MGFEERPLGWLVLVRISTNKASPPLQNHITLASSCEWSTKVVIRF